MRTKPVNSFIGIRADNENYGILNYNVDYTYRCNLNCGDCNRFLGQIPWKGDDSDLTVEDVIVSSKLLVSNRIKVKCLNATGGEPLLNPHFWNLRKQFYLLWKPRVWFYCYSNGLTEVPKELKGKFFRIIPVEAKIEKHNPCFVSPTDLGFCCEDTIGKYCRIMANCGRNFSHYGFTFCQQAPHIARLMGIDICKAYPVLEGDPDICRHCFFSLSKGMRNKLTEDIKLGKLEYPSKFYREGFLREKEDPTKFTTFLDKLSVYRDVSIG